MSSAIRPRGDCSKFCRLEQKVARARKAKGLGKGEGGGGDVSISPPGGRIRWRVVARTVNGNACSCITGHVVRRLCRLQGHLFHSVVDRLTFGDRRLCWTVTSRRPVSVSVVWLGASNCKCANAGGNKIDENEKCLATKTVFKFSFSLLNSHHCHRRRQGDNIPLSAPFHGSPEIKCDFFPQHYVLFHRISSKLL